MTVMLGSLLKMNDGVMFLLGYHTVGQKVTSQYGAEIFVSMS